MSVLHTDTNKNKKKTKNVLAHIKLALLKYTVTKLKPRINNTQKMEGIRFAGATQLKITPEHD